MKTVFLTGATGFVGAYLIQYLLQKGYRVRALRRERSNTALIQSIENQVEWVVGDILDEPLLEDALQGVQHVYHAAALVSYQPTDAELLLQINHQGTANLVNAALYAGVEKFLHVSSIAALGRKEHQTHFDENTQWENTKLNSNYAISKFRGECEVWRGIEEGLSAVIVNPSVIVGAGYWHTGTGHFFRQVAKGLSFYPVGRTGFVDVRDVAKASIALMESDITAQRFILNGENWTYQQLFETIARALQRRAPRLKLPAWLGELAWRADYAKSRLLGTQPLITQEIIQKTQGDFNYSNEKIIKAIGYQFQPLAETIQQTALAYQQSQAEHLQFGLLPLD